jgi:PAS domain-containing protein
MSVYQSLQPTQIVYKYDRFNLQEGQLLAAQDPGLINFLSKHPNFREITDETLRKLAPPLHLIKDPQDPYRMRKEDVLRELMSYGIKVDPYSFSEKLSSQLTLARKMMRRNFVTVLNERGVPVFIDRLKIPTPVISEKDESLPEPSDPVGEYYTAGEEKKQTPPVEGKTDKKHLDDKLPPHLALSAEFVPDERSIQGANFDDFIIQNMDKQANIEKEKKIQDLLLAEQGKRVEIEEFTKAKEQEEAVIQQEESKHYVKCDEIKSENYKFLLDILPQGVFLLNEPTPEEKRDMRVISWREISSDAMETYCRYYKVPYVYNHKDTDKRWRMMDTVKAYIETLSPEAQEKANVEINMLQRRVDELTKYEPDYRKTKNKILKKKASEIRRYGLDTWYNDSVDIMSHLRKMYMLAKLGLQIPDTAQGIEELLIKYKRLEAEVSTAVVSISGETSV